MTTLLKSKYKSGFIVSDQRSKTRNSPVTFANECRRFIDNKQGCKRDVEVRDETETFGFQFETRPIPYHFSRDRDRDVQFWVRDETETLISRDRDIFRDLSTLSFIS